MKRILFLFTLITLLLSTAVAQNISFKVSAPSVVVKGQQFQVSYTINSDSRDFRSGSFGELDVLMGPSTSTSMSTQIVNGQVNSETTNTYTFVLMANKEGNYPIPAASVKVKGQQYSSNSTTIKVLPEDKNANSNSEGNDNSQSSSNAAISSDGLFMRTNLSKASVFQGEAILMTIKLYSQHDVSRVENAKIPDLEGFFVQDIDLDPNRQMSLENYNGSNYRTFIIKQALIFPQRSGKLTLPQNQLELILRLQAQRRSRSIFDDFFGSYSEVKKAITSSPVTVNVKASPPGAPASFEGFVGNLSLSSKISKESVKTNESVTISLTFNGNGNLKLIKTPSLQFPADFEAYDPKITNNFKVSTSGVNGSKSIEYLVIPRYAGDFTIPSVEYTYLDGASGQYKTLRTQAFKIHVEKGVGDNTPTTVSGNYTNKENVRFLGKDIRFIRSGDLKLKSKEETFFASPLYISAYLVPLLLFIVLAFVYRKRAIANSNIALQRTKKANKVAIKRLKTANAFMLANQSEAFYDELLKALWGYLSDKLSLPLSSLNKDNIATELARYGASEEVVSEFISMLNTCEYARYAPVNEENAMSNLYNHASEAINQMESIIKR